MRRKRRQRRQAKLIDVGGDVFGQFGERGVCCISLAEIVNEFYVIGASEVNHQSKWTDWIEIDKKKIISHRKVEQEVVSE